MSTITTDCDAPVITGEWKGRLRTIRCEHVNAGELIVLVCDDGSSIELTVPIATSGAMKSALRDVNIGLAVDEIQDLLGSPVVANQGLSRPRTDALADADQLDEV